MRVVCQRALQQGANGLLLQVQPYLHLSDAGVFDLTQPQSEPQPQPQPQPGDDTQPWTGTLETLSAAEQVTLAAALRCTALHCVGVSSDSMRIP